jgi:hypothetical protein
MALPLVSAENLKIITMDPNSNNPNPNANNDNETSKRQAMTGQWRTPPLPVFASTQQQQQAPQPMPSQPSIVAVPPTKLPESTDDYAKALQEAYRRGAEAAAAMQQQQNMPNAVSCPNFHQLPTGNVAPSSNFPSAPQPPQAVAVPPPQQAPAVASSVALPQQQPVFSVPNPLADSTGENRSFSLPDMASYAARAQAEEEKRKKRLARNRASARLRRLRKKNLVDSYEGEVGVLELSLQKLKAHEWGQGHPHEALLEALGMERGQQALKLEERQALISSILEQQRAQLDYLREAQLEQQVLKEFVSGNEPNDPLWQELQGVLNLSEDQKTSLQRATSGLEEEVQAMETLEQCLDAMSNRLTNDGVHSISSQFLQIFHPNQIQKFLLWTDANAEAIDQLDYCHSSPPAASPIFSFGMDDGGASQLHFSTEDGNA